MRFDCPKTWLALCMSAVMLLGGCVFNRSTQPEVYKVQPGDSLSAIARHYGLDWHELARWNNIGPPCTIYGSERLSLDPFPPLDYDDMRRQRQAARDMRQSSPRSTVTAMEQDRSVTVSGLPQQRQQQSDAPRQPAAGDYGPVTSAPEPTGGQESVDEPKSTSEQTSSGDANSASNATAKTPPPPLVNKAGWRWPLATSILENHPVEAARHGFNLYGAAGTPVYAAHKGEVVYSGASLQGIGQLVIIKHGGEYLSAYGYVRNVQVSEGDRITAGQHIADMGIGPGSRAELHFEVRHKGEPIDPQSVLPKL